MNRSIALIGMRGAGKSAVGRELAGRLGVPLVDTDELVVRATGLSIAAIFGREGEGGFRRLERDAVGEAVRRVPAVISVGGGAVVDPASVAALRSVATVVWLTAPLHVLHQRLTRDPATASSRPALTGLSPIDELRNILAAREPLYRAAAHLIVDASAYDPSAIAETILRQLQDSTFASPVP